MLKNYPACDGFLHYWDGYTGAEKLCTHPVLGVNYFKRFGFIHNPDYAGSWSDNESTELATILGKRHYCNKPIAIHNWVGKNPDAICKADLPLFHRDKPIYESRKARGFDLPIPDLSILIPTLESRDKTFRRISTELYRQIFMLPGDSHWRVELRYLKDNKELPVGQKRQALLEAARGKYICFVDDDDDVNPDYVGDILYALSSYRRTHSADPDCIVFAGLYSHDGVIHGNFDYDLVHKKNQNLPRRFLRIPNHLCPVRAAISRSVGFAPLTHGEDTKYAEGIYPQIKTQAVVVDACGVKKSLYHYKFSTTGTETQKFRYQTREALRA